jgi:hypothetical protein
VLFQVDELRAKEATADADADADGTGAGGGNGTVLWLALSGSISERAVDVALQRYGGSLDLDRGAVEQHWPHFSGEHPPTAADLNQLSLNVYAVSRQPTVGR